jgi:hypothetical protein
LTPEVVAGIDGHVVSQLWIEKAEELDLVQVIEVSDRGTPPKARFAIGNEWIYGYKGIVLVRTCSPVDHHERHVGR